MTIQTHSVDFDIPSEEHRAIVYYDRTKPSLDTLEQLLNPHNGVLTHMLEDSKRMIHRGTPVDFISTRAKATTLPVNLHPLVPGPPLDDLHAYPLVVVVYEGLVVSWQGHDPDRLDAWILDPGSVRGHLRRSQDRVEALRWDANPPIHWPIDPSHLLLKQP